MRWAILMISAITAFPAIAQEGVVASADTAAPKISAREKWGLSMEQYILIDPSRRPSGEAFKYWKARKRGPYGNLLERVPGGPLRPVRF